MKDKDFQQLADHEFAQLEWTDAQRLHTLRQMNKEERPVMKRKLYVVIITAMLLLTLTGTAVAAGLNITTLQEFFDHYHSFEVTWEIIPDLVNQSAVVKPIAQRHTSNLVDVTVDQMYLSDKALYLTVHYAPKQPNTLLFDGRHKSIVLDGEDKHYWDLWNTELTLLEINGISLDDLNGQEPLVRCEYSDSTRDPETGALTQMYVFKDPESIDQVRSRTGGTLMFRFEVGNKRNYDVEWNALFIDFPRMETVPVDYAPESLDSTAN